MESSLTDPISLLFSLISGIFTFLIFLFIIWKIKKGIGNAATLFQKGTYVDGKFVLEGREVPDEVQEVLKDEDHNNIPDIVDQLRGTAGKGSFFQVTQGRDFANATKVPRKVEIMPLEAPVVEEGTNAGQLLFGLLGVIILIVAWYFLG